MLFILLSVFLKLLPNIFADVRDQGVNTDVVTEGDVVIQPFPSSRRNDPAEPVQSTSSQITSLTSQRQPRRKKTARSSDIVRCEVCGRKYEELTTKKEIWIQCGYRGCSYWTHPRCHGFSARSASSFEKINFLCPKHR